MNCENNIQYEQIAKAIEYIQSHFKQQPSLQEIAGAVDLSPHHFQRLFSQWAGVSPKKFMQFTSIEYAKTLLKQQQLSVFDASCETGLSSTSRLHDLFVNIEAMTPGQYKNGGETLTINYSFAHSPFGEILIASTPRGICHLSFIDNQVMALNYLKETLPNASYTHNDNQFHQNALLIFTNDGSKLDDIQLHLKGTDFQLKVWQCLLNIPLAKLTTYGYLAKEIQQAGASRAIGNAVGKNPVAYLIPCHRVIQASGAIGGYRWGADRKSAMIAWEASTTYK